MKAVLYQDSFIFVRSNSCKGGRTHGEILKEDRHWISTEVLRLPPIFLDEESRESFLANFNYRGVTISLPTPSEWRFALDKNGNSFIFTFFKSRL